MAFWSKRDAKGQDLQAVKTAIARVPPVYASPPSPPAFSAPLPTPLPMPQAAQPVDEALSHGLNASEFAPLFVKIDRYKEILQKLEEIKVSLHGMTDVMILLNEIEHIRDSTVKALRQSVTDLTDALIALDSEFVRPQDVEIDVPRSRERTRVESYVSDLQSELASLKKELNKIK